MSAPKSSAEYTTADTSTSQGLSWRSPRSTRVGGVLWMLMVVFFAMLAVGQAGFAVPYSWIRNAVSDLGATSCFHSTQVDAWVCSPWHQTVNIGWIVAGACLAAGSVLVARAFPRTRLARIGLGFYALSGIGVVSVGLNPEDLQPTAHVLSALIAIPGGILGMVFLGAALRRARQWPVFGLIGMAVGPLSLVSLALALGGLGGPGMFGLWERIGAFPGFIWAIVAGIRILTSPSVAASASPTR